jgi:uncharacterized membrane protein
MNTVFKFYIQAWLLWGVAAAYASAVLLSEVKQRRWSMGYSVVFLLVLMVGLSYPAYAINQKIDEFQQADRTLLLDGTQHPWYLTPDDHAAVDWLKQAPLGTLVEAVGGSYTHYARISAHSGQPALLGWPGHESQWRGGGEEMGSRQGDIEKLYTTTSWAEAQQILETYNIRYVYVGPLELSTYPVSVFKFNDFLQVVFVSGPVTVYEAPGWEPGN